MSACVSDFDHSLLHFCCKVVVYLLNSIPH